MALRIIIKSNLNKFYKKCQYIICTYGMINLIKINITKHYYYYFRIIIIYSRHGFISIRNSLRYNRLGLFFLMVNIILWYQLDLI